MLLILVTLDKVNREAKFKIVSPGFDLILSLILTDDFNIILVCYDLLQSTSNLAHFKGFKSRFYIICLHHVMVTAHGYIIARIFPALTIFFLYSARIPTSSTRTVFPSLTHYFMTS